MGFLVLVLLLVGQLAFGKCLCVKIQFADGDTDLPRRPGSILGGLRESGTH